MKISGLMVTHQCEEFDYCYKEALQSLIETCDEVVIVDGESTDGTRDVISDIAVGNWRVKIIDAKWEPIPGTNGQWLSDLYNLAKANASHSFQFGLQADEVLHEIDRETIRSMMIPTSFRRLNFWKDPQHFLPDGKACGSRVYRLGTSDIKFMGDAESMDVYSVPHARQDSDVCIFHYGFLRKTESLIKKSISLEGEVFGHHNILFERMKSDGREPFDSYYGPLREYHGPHPKYAHEWLDSRGYDSGRYIAARAITPFIKPEYVGVEIGVFMGDSSRFLMRYCSFLYLVDPCIPYEGNPDSTVFASEKIVRDKLNGRPYEFIKGMSHEVHERVPEVDFVFIDGNHTYEYVQKDISLYWPKIRSGGFISGHDYGPGFPGVVSAVQEFSKLANLPVSIHGDCWLVHKP